MSMCEHGYTVDCAQCLRAELVAERLRRQKAHHELATIKKKARAAVNAPYEDVFNMGLRQALRELEEVL